MERPERRRARAPGLWGLAAIDQQLNNIRRIEQMVNTAKTPTPTRAAAEKGRSMAVAGPRRQAAAAAPRRRMTAAGREQQILKGAVEFFARRGLEAQTRELADELGITHALLYHYFPTKGRLIERVYEQLIAGRWDPAWEALLDGKLAPEEKLCTFYGAYLEAILTPEWLRTLVHSGLADGLIPERYFGLLRERLFPRLIREARRAAGSRSRAAASAREEALLLGFHGGLIYQLGIMPLVYGQRPRGHGDARVSEVFIRDMVQAYLAQAAAAARPGVAAAAVAVVAVVAQSTPLAARPR
jgi:AcrR family transcriptional regulator